MPHYAFQLGDQTQSTMLELPNDQIAWATVIDACGQLLRSVDFELCSGIELEVRVSDGQGEQHALRIAASRSA